MRSMKKMGETGLDHDLESIKSMQWKSPAEIVQDQIADWKDSMEIANHIIEVCLQKQEDYRVE